MKGFFTFFENCAFYGLKTEPEHEPEPKKIKSGLWIWIRINLSSWIRIQEGKNDLQI